MAKVKCRVCTNEVSGVCSIKKASVRVNKSRTCEAFVYNPSKVKVHVEVPTVKFGYAEQQEAKRKRKEELRKAQEALKASQNVPISTQIPTSTGNSMYPTTGDLSRFITSAEKDGE